MASCSSRMQMIDRSIIDHHPSFFLPASYLVRQDYKLFTCFDCVGKESESSRVPMEMDCFGEAAEEPFPIAVGVDGVTDLHFAASKGRTQVCKHMIEGLNLDIDVRDSKGLTPLHFAIIGDHHGTATYLLSRKASLAAADDMGRTALPYAALKGFTKLIVLLISKGADLEATGVSGTPLQCAAGLGKKKAVKVLLNNHANPNAVYNHMFAPLMVYVIAESYECVKLLLQAGADPNICLCGGTPLEMAVSEGETDIVKCLLDAGANPNITNIYGLTPLEIAAIGSNHELVTILLPLTSWIPTIPNWSYSGIFKHVQSEAAVHQASMADPSAAAVLSNRSLCWARMNEGRLALSDAQTCLKLDPNYVKAYYREGVAWNMLKDFTSAADSFSSGLQLDPGNKELQDAFRKAVEACESEA